MTVRESITAIMPAKAGIQSLAQQHTVKTDNYRERATQILLLGGVKQWLAPRTLPGFRLALRLAGMTETWSSGQSQKHDIVSARL